MRQYISAQSFMENASNRGCKQGQGGNPSTQSLASATLTSSQLKSLLSGSSLCSRQTSDQADQRMGDSSTSAPNGLPISLQIGDYKVWDYLVEVMSRGWSDFGSFRLSPAYSLYLALRFFHSHAKPYLVQFFNRIGHHMNQIAQECSSRDELLFWLANASELYYLVEKDHDLRTPPRSGHLGSVVEIFFRRLCVVLLGSLRPACQPLINTYNEDDEGSAEVISILDSTLRAARASRLNAALTIQLCSHMFHDINTTLFNCLVGVSVPIQLTTQLGKCLQVRLTALYRWAEQMGVELAAECHLDRCRQAANLLAAQKNDVAALGATCYKLNSLQVRYLLSHFVLRDGEIPCDNDVMARVFGLAERQADELTIEDGLTLSLGETEELSLPFLLPQDGYTAGTFFP
uniref:Dilute domain-containing protein n=1 Tax=Heterorhabditis bacteriophora TaxID=37862 RepID=A0A1I7XGZ4_HETBA